MARDWSLSGACHGLQSRAAFHNSGCAISQIMAHVTLSVRCSWNPKEVAQQLGITTTTLYTYVNGDGSPKAAGQHLLEAARAAEPHAGRPGRARHVSP
jgi:hypothetical protein